MNYTLLEEGISSKELYKELGLSEQNYARWCQRNITDNAALKEGIDYKAVVCTTLPSEELENTGLKPNYGQEYYLTQEVAFALTLTSGTEKGIEIREKLSSGIIKQMRELRLELQNYDSKLENLNKRLLDLEKEKINKSAFAEDCEPYFKTLIAYYGRNPKSPARYFANKESITEFVINEMEKDYADFNWERVKREYILTYRCTLPRDIFAIFEGLKDYQMRFLLTLEAMAERKEVTNALSVE